MCIDSSQSTRAPNVRSLKGTFMQNPGNERNGAGISTSPRSATEQLLLEIWSEVLLVDRIGIYDNFIDLGGHSLSATLCINRIRSRLGVDLPIDALFLEAAN